MPFRKAEPFCEKHHCDKRLTHRKRKKNGQNIDGIQYICDMCQHDRTKGYRNTNPDKSKKQQAAYYQNNKKEIAKKRKAQKKERSVKQKQHYKENKQKILTNNKKYRDKHRDEINEKQKNVRNQNKDEINKKRREKYAADPITANQKQKKYRDGLSSDKKASISDKRSTYYQNNKKTILVDSKDYYARNKDKILPKIKQYADMHKKEIATRNNKREKVRRKEDPVFRLRKDVSRIINIQLRKNGGSKHKSSILEYLGNDYFEKLKSHLETLFSHPDNLTPDGKIWMTMDNQGKYNRKTWIDDDYSTHTWNMDHIMPLAQAPCSTMDHFNFEKSWNIFNIRPLSAKQNIKDGDNRDAKQIAEIKKNISNFFESKKNGKE